MPKYVLTAAKRGVTSVRVDDVRLRLDGPPVDLTADQAARCRDLPDVVLRPAVDPRAARAKPRPAKRRRKSNPSGGSTATTNTQEV